jgi:hypothetical protein
MAGTVTQTHTKRGPVGVVTLSWTADAADGSVPNTDLAVKISGKLLALETTPGATAPTDLYDITLTDSDGHDVLEGVGANRSATTTEKAAVVFSGTSVHPPVSAEDTLTFKLSGNSVNSATGTAKIYYEGQAEG